MRTIKYSPARRSSTRLNLKAQVDRKNTKEIELEFRDSGEVYYVKLDISDLFNLILMLIK